MDKKFKINIQEALKAELKKEGIWDKIADPIAGAYQGAMNIPRGIRGQFQLGAVNKKLERSAKRIDKDWQDAKDLADKKSTSMQTSKNPQVARMGMDVQKNVDAVDQTMASAIQRIASLASVGAEAPEHSTGGGSQTDSDFEKWLERWNAPGSKFSKAGRERLFSKMFLPLLQAGVDPMTANPKDWATLQNITDIKSLIAWAKHFGLNVPPDWHEKYQAAQEKVAGPSASGMSKKQKKKLKKQRRREAQAQQQATDGDVDNAVNRGMGPPQVQVPDQETPAGQSEREKARERMRQKMGMSGGAPQQAPQTPPQTPPQGTPQVDIDMLENMYKLLLRELEKKQGAPATPDQKQAAAQKVKQKAQKMRIKPFKGGRTKIKISPVKEPVQQQAPQKVGLPPKKVERPKELSPEELSQMPLPDFGLSDYYGTNGGEEEAAPFPLTKTRPRPKVEPQPIEEPIVEPSIVPEQPKKKVPRRPKKATSAAKPKKETSPTLKQFYEEPGAEPEADLAGDVPSKINKSGERQFGLSPSEDPEGEGHSATDIRPEKTFKPKSSRPTARRKKK